MDSGKIPSPEVLKIGSIIGFNSLPKISINPRPMSISEIIKKGSREGKIILNHTRIPWLADCKDKLGLDIMPNKRPRSKSRKNIFI